MNINIRTYRPITLQNTRAKEPGNFSKRLTSRRCVAIATTLILAGLSIPALMAVKLLPITLPLGFAGFALVATGGVMALVFCGEI